MLGCVSELIALTKMMHTALMVLLHHWIMENLMCLECLFLLYAWATTGGGGWARRGSTRVMICGARTDCRAYRVTTRLAGQRQPVTCDDGCLSHWLPSINSQGLSAGRSGADSVMRRSGMPRYSVRASCLDRVEWAGGREGSCSVSTYDFRIAYECSCAGAVLKIRIHLLQPNSQ